MKRNHEKGPTSLGVDSKDVPQMPYLWVSRVWQIVPAFELAGFLLDHRFKFKQHWIEANLSNGDRLSNGLKEILQLEMLLAALMLGFTSGVYFGNLTPEIVEDFQELRVGTLGFWCVATGTVALLTTLLTVATIYLSAIMLRPVSSANMAAYLRCKAVQDALHLPSILLVMMFMLVTTLVTLTLLRRNGGFSLICALVVFPPGFGVFSYVIGLYGVALNLGLKSGAYSNEPVIARSTVLTAPAGLVESTMWAKAIKNSKEGRIEQPHEFYSSNSPL